MTNCCDDQLQRPLYVDAVLCHRSKGGVRKNFRLLPCKAAPLAGPVLVQRPASMPSCSADAFCRGRHSQNQHPQCERYAD